MKKIVNLNKLNKELEKKILKDQARVIQENDDTIWYVTNKGVVYEKSKNSIGIKKSKTHIDILGYEKVVINGVLHYVHRLVAIAFIPNPFNLPCVNHKRGTKKGKLLNTVENLEWVSEAENLEHARKRGYNKYQRLTEDEKQLIIEMIETDENISSYKIEKALKLGYQRINNFRKQLDRSATSYIN